MMQRSLLIGAVTVLALCYGGIAASASTTKAATAFSRNCVARAVPIGSSATATTANVTCYATFAAAVRAATGGRVRLPASAKPGSVTPAQLDPPPSTPDATFVLSVDYQNDNFGGNTLFWTQSAACGNFETPNMPSGWNDQISSVAASSGCATTLFQNDKFAGSIFEIKKNASVSALGSFNDEASSQTWCTSYPCGS